MHLVCHTEGHVAADEVQRHLVVGDVLYGEVGFVGNLLVYLHIVHYHLAQVGHSGLELPVFVRRTVFLQSEHLSLHVGDGLCHLFELQSPECLHDGCYVAVGQCQGLDDPGVDTSLIQVVLLGDINFRVALTDYTND